MIKSSQEATSIVSPIRNAKPSRSASTLHRLRNAVAFLEPEDAKLTGMTRSLDRRLLALNLQQMSPAGEPVIRKVA